MNKSHNKFSHLIIYLLLSVGYISIAMHLPVSIYTQYGHDHALYWTNAQHIINGNWLGPYNQLTLAKSPGFSIFLAVNYIIGIPVTLSIALLYLFACWLLTNSLRNLGLNEYLALFLFFVLLFHPQLFPTSIIRDNIYPALTLIVIVGAINIINFKTYQNHLFKLSFFGLAFGFFWLTREEGFWIVPGILLLILLKIIQLLKGKFSTKDLFYCIIVFSITAYVPVFTVSLINFNRYGNFEVVDTNGVFSRALKSLNSVDVGQDLPYLPVSFEKRQAIYNISPSFLQLEDFFENTGRRWTKVGCEFYPHTCDDYTGGWFMWAFRDAVYSKGHYQSSFFSNKFYNDISTEIETACKNGLVNCKRNPVPFLPNITMIQLKEIPEKFLEAFKLALFLSPIPAIEEHSFGPLDQLQAIRLFLGNPKTTFSPEEKIIRINGWYYSLNQDWIVLECLKNGGINNYNIERFPSPDIADFFKDQSATLQRFSITISENSKCSIYRNPAMTEKVEIYSFLIENKHEHKFQDSSILYIDNISKNTEIDKFLYHIPSKIKQLLTRIYENIMPIIIFSGIIGYLFFLIRSIIKKQLPMDLFFVATMLWFLFILRVGILVLIDISSFPAIKHRYISPAYPPLCIAAILSAGLFFLKTKIHAENN
jgi:hypothetical protein